MKRPNIVVNVVNTFVRTIQQAVSYNTYIKMYAYYNAHSITSAAHLDVQQSITSTFIAKQL